MTRGEGRHHNRQEAARRADRLQRVSRDIRDEQDCTDQAYMTG